MHSVAPPLIFTCLSNSFGTFFQFGKNVFHCEHERTEGIYSKQYIIYTQNKYHAIIFTKARNAVHSMHFFTGKHVHVSIAGVYIKKTVFF